MHTFTIALAQTNMLVGDVANNAQHVINLAQEARDRLKAQIVVFPELTLCGYPPEDLLLRADFLERTALGLAQVTAAVVGIDVVLGYAELAGSVLYNCAAVLRDGQVLAVYRKQTLPNYGVFDEKRYFSPGTEACVFELNGVLLGLSICEDIWVEGPIAQSVQAGAKLILNLNASPYHADKFIQREAAVRQRALAAEVPVVYVNLVGGQDEVVFDGASFVLDAQGQTVFRAAEFQESLSPVVFGWDGKQVLPIATTVQAPPTRTASIYQALVAGIRDYVNKNGFKGAVLGLSGGIDSALVLALAVDALGAEHVEAVLMPSRYTANMSIEDAKAEADALGACHHLIPIEPAFAAFNSMLANTFAGLPPDTTEENIQARCRGVILMAISNKTGKILLTTGNKSEMSVGYATLYGDMAGGFAPIKDVPKLLVYELAEYRNSVVPVIPQRVIERPPSAELRPDQKDEDSLPPYSVLDPILALYVEQDKSLQEIIAAGYAENEVRRVVAMVDRNEYKRRQTPPGIKITPRAFGRDRRYPITSGFKGAS